MSDLGRLQPLITVDLVITDHPSYAVIENLCPAAGQRIDAGGFEAFQRISQAELCAFCKERDLHHGKRLEVHPRESFFESGDEIQEVLEREVRMQSANNMELGHCFGISRRCRLPGFFERHGVSALGVLLASEGAKATGGNTNIGGIDVAIHVKERGVAPHAFSDVIGEPSNGENVRRAIQSQAVREAESLLRYHFFSDPSKPSLVGLECVPGMRYSGRSTGLKRAGHCLDDS